MVVDSGFGGEGSRRGSKDNTAAMEVNNKN